MAELLTLELIAPEVRGWAWRTITRVRQREARLNGRSDGPPLARRARRLCIVHLDGVPRRLVAEAISQGSMPFLARLVRSGAYHMDTAFWGSPASTPAFQAGLLYGIRHPNLPAFQWFDRELGRTVVMSSPRDAHEMDQRLSRLTHGDSLLGGGGTAYLSLFRAGASNLFSMSALANLRAVWKAAPAHLRGLRDARVRGFFHYVADMVRDLAEMGRDMRRWVARVKDWRHERQFMFNRFFLASIGWHLSHTRALIDMARGVPAIYLVYGAYDEVSHRRGPFSDQARAELFRIDRDLEALYAVGRMVEVPYDLYLMADHGHVDSTPFENRQGRRLGSLLLDGPPERLREPVIRGLLDGRAAPATGRRGEDEPEVIEAGNFSHVYLTRGPERLEARDLMERFLDVLARAASCKEIGIVMVRRGESAAAIIQGEVFGPEEIERAPLAREFSRRAVLDMLRELPRMKTAGDLVLYGESVAPTGTVGFAWEWGSHGGLTSIETDSVVLWPADAPLDLSGLSHSAEAHRRFSEAYRG